MSSLEERFAQLPAAKQKLLLQKMKERQEAGATAGIPVSPRRRDSEPFPLSSSQQRVWFLDQLDPGTPAFNIPTALRLAGALDRDALEGALNEIVRRHESLRTSFPTVDGEAVQKVAPPVRQELPFFDVSHLEPEGREAEAKRHLLRLAGRQFDLANGPLVDFGLVRLADEEHLLILVLHHIVSDGWSMGILRRDLVRFYAAKSGKADELPPEPRLQYGDFADWQQSWLAGDGPEVHLDYWREQLADVPVLELVTDHPRPAAQTFRGASVWLELPEALVARLRALGQKEDAASLYMVLLAGFKALLFRYGGQSDLSVGTFIAGRNRPEIEDVIGFFVNNLALRTRVDATLGFRELVARVRHTTLDAYTHQDVPFEKLLEVLQPERDMSRPSLFQVMCVLQNAPTVSDEQMPGLTLTQEDLGGGNANFDLTLWMHEMDGGVACQLQYNADLFEEATVERLGKRFATLLEAVLDAPDRPLSTLPLVDEAERGQLGAWSSGAQAGIGGEPVHRRFERRAAETPEAPAVMFEGRRLSYGDLDARADRLGNHLRSLGAGPEVPVVLCLPRCLEMTAAVLGILKAGAAYVPMEPESGPERLRLMLRDCGAPIVVTRQSLLDDLGLSRSESKPRAVCLDADEPEITATSSARVEVEVGLGNAAYVIYTSGSTGRPKGVVVSHGALANYVAGAVEAYGLTPRDQVFQFASLAFDASAEEIYPALTSGATLVVRSEPPASAQRFLAGCADAGITVLNLPTAYWHTLVGDLEKAGTAWLDALRLLIIGGEQAQAETLAQWRRRAGKVRLVNTYGPTEGTIVATRWEPPAGGRSERVPIGRPIANVGARVLDRRLQPRPVRWPGELCLAGAGLARGYLGRPGLTAERFVPDPEADGGRLYRTGDLARWREDGELDFLGRLDRQVKIRGYRVEPGEVEAALLAHPEVREAAVVLRPDSRSEGTGENLFVAYVVAGDAPPGDLRDFLSTRLPDYMTPAVYLFLDALPLNFRGKVDRAALARRPLPASEEAESRVTYVAPRNETEEVLAEIYEEVLSQEQIGVYDNFFDRGGHSLLATRLATRVRDAFEIELPLRSLFEAPTIARLAVVVEDLIIAELEGMSDEELELLEQDA